LNAFYRRRERRPAVARWLKSHGHEVFSVYHEARGIDDEAIIYKAYHEHWILITGDKDFGEKVSGGRPAYPARPHPGPTGRICTARQGLQKALSARGNPRLDNINAIMRAIGYQLMPRRMENTAV